MAYGSVKNLASDDKAFFASSQRHRLNLVAAMACLFVPWIIFCLVYGIYSFDWHYDDPTLCNYLLVIGGVMVFGFGVMACWEAFRKMRRVAEHEPNWWTFLFLTSLVGYSVGIVLGNLNFWTYMQNYYEYKDLNQYNDVDPARMRGEQMMDAGRVKFVNDTVIDLKRSMGFRNMDIYCVAPITLQGLPLDSYDFWAVGLGCCSSNAADFHCGEYNNPDAQSGLRLLSDEQRPFYRLAVQQAESEYGIKATHPLFFFWVQDADLELQYIRDEGYKYYLVGMLAHFGWQILSIALAVCAFQGCQLKT